MCTMFQVDLTSTSSKTTLTKNLNLKPDRSTDKRKANEWRNKRTDGKIEAQIRKHNAHKWGIKI